MNNKEQWKIDYENMLVKATGYSGNKEPGKKSISCSSLTSNMLELYLDFKYGKQIDTKFEASNTGSMYQLGVDSACNDNEQYISAERIEYELENGWILTGEIDQRDIVNKVIIDNKLSTKTALDKVKSEGLNHNYTMQLAGYKFLVNKKYGEDYTGALAFVDKSSSYFKPTSGPNLNLVDVETVSYEELESMALEKTNELQWYLDNNEEPPVCADRFPYKSKGGVINMKCRHYCSYNKHCKHYNDFASDKKQILSFEPTKKKEEYSLDQNYKF